MDNHSGDLTVLQINDTHAYLEPHYEVFAAGGRMEYRVAGGYAAIATLVRQTRDERKGRCCCSTQEIPSMVPTLRCRPGGGHWCR